MPPRKKARLSPPSVSTPQQDVQTVDTATPTAPETPSKIDPLAPPIAFDPWKDDQEIILYKGLIRWKPAGMHRHFRMIALSQFMRDHGYGTAREPHTRIPGIWKKLESVYNLEAIHEREDAFLEPDDNVKDTEGEPFFPFVLPKDEYLDAMLERAPATDGSSSPAMLERPRPTKRRGKANRQSGRAQRASTVEDTEEEPKSSPAPGRTKRGGRMAQSAKQTPKSRVQAEARASSTRRGSKVLSSSPVEGDSAASGMETNEEGDEENEEDDDENAGDDSAAGGSPSARTTRHAPKPGRGSGVKSRGRGGIDRRRSTRNR